MPLLASFKPGPDASVDTVAEHYCASTVEPSQTTCTVILRPPLNTTTDFPGNTSTFPPALTPAASVVPSEE
jgi:hypothetical protein